MGTLKGFMKGLLKKFFGITIQRTRSSVSVSVQYPGHNGSIKARRVADTVYSKIAIVAIIFLSLLPVVRYKPDGNDLVTNRRGHRVHRLAELSF